MAYQITLAVGILLLAIAIFLAYQSVGFMKNSEKANGKVIELEEKYTSGSNGATYKPVFEFIISSGEKIIFKSISASNPPSWTVGEEAIYAFNIDSPNNGRIVTFFGIFGWSVALACLAMPCLIIGGGYFMSNSFFENLLKTI